MTSPLVSICCVTYNHAPFIRKCLDGFLMQQTTFPVEILIHDDASTDSTDSIIREYAAKYPDKIFPLFEEENQYSKPCHKQLDWYNYERVRGKYIAYCEGDDYWTDPLKLQKQVDFMETHLEYSACFHNFHCNDSRSDQVIYPKNYNYLESQQAGIDVTVDDYFHKHLIQPLTMLFRLSMFSFDWQKQYKYYRDTHEIYHLLRAGKGYWMNFDGGVYTRHNGGISTSATVEKSRWEEREHILELYLNTKDKVLADYLVEILLWNYDTYVRKNDKRSFHEMMTKYRQVVPRIAMKVYFIIAKRKFNKSFRR